MKVIKERKSQKDYTPIKELSLQRISEILYCVQGYNNFKEEIRTVASGMTIFPFELYVVLHKGIYYYEEKDHSLKTLEEGDYMEKT